MTLEGIRKIIEGMTVKIDIDSKPIVLTEPKVIEEFYSKVVKNPKPELKVEESELKVEELEVKEPLIETLVDLSVEPTMELVPSLTVISLRSSDVYDPLQIFRQETGSQKIGVLVYEFSVELSCLIMMHISCLSCRQLQLVCHENQFHLHHLGSAMTHQY